MDSVREDMSPLNISVEIKSGMLAVPVIVSFTTQDTTVGGPLGNPALSKQCNLSNAV